MAHKWWRRLRHEDPAAWSTAQGAPGDPRPGPPRAWSAVLSPCLFATKSGRPGWPRCSRCQLRLAPGNPAPRALAFVRPGTPQRSGRATHRDLPAGRAGSHRRQETRSEPRWRGLQGPVSGTSLVKTRVASTRRDSDRGYRRRTLAAIFRILVAIRLICHLLHGQFVNLGESFSQE